MPQEPLYLISPNYTHDKLDAPSHIDLVDVFEDRMRYWLITPATQLLDLPHGAVSAVALALSYFEGIEIYCSGQDSNHKSKEFFRRGFKRVFDIGPSGEHVYDEVVNGLYVQARCGFAHDGLFRNRVFFSERRAEALTVTWPRKNGEFIKDGHLESVIVNPRRFCESIRVHFCKYIAALRSENDTLLMENFLRAVDLNWGLNEADRVIGMTEEEFLNGG